MSNVGRGREDEELDMGWKGQDFVIPLLMAVKKNKNGWCREVCWMDDTTATAFFFGLDLSGNSGRPGDGEGGEGKDWKIGEIRWGDGVDGMRYVPAHKPEVAGYLLGGRLEKGS